MLRRLYPRRTRHSGGRAGDPWDPVRVRLPLICAALSGTAGLLYQVIWNRQLLLLFGSTSAAVAAVVAAFMGGMGLGAWGVERWDLKDRRRALGLYALLELGTAGFALIFPLLLSVLQVLYPALWQAVEVRPEWLNALRLGLGMATLSPPTLMMGATLPLLVATLQSDPRRAEKAVGWVYGLNAGGGALGAATTGLLLLPTLGLSETRWAGVALSVSAALLAILARVSPRSDVPSHPLPWHGSEALPNTASQGLPVGSRRVWIGVLAGTGFASMGYEVLWTRMLVLVTGSSTYAFSLMLALDVAGLALGSLWLATKVARLRSPADLFSHLQMGGALLAIAGLWLFGRYPDWQLGLYQTWGTTFGTTLLIDGVLAALIIVPPTVLLGAAFPVATELLTGNGHRARATSTALAAVALGNAAGALAAGSALVPKLGLEGGLTALAGLSAVCGVIGAFTLGSHAGRRVSVAAAIVLVSLGSTLLPRWNPLLLTSGVYERAPVYLSLLGGSVRLDNILKDYRLLDYQTDNQAVVSVIRFPTLRERPHLALSIDGKVDASTGEDMSTQILSGDIGKLLRPAARNVFVVGLASGVTVGAVEQWSTLQHLVVAEISPAVVRVEHWFAPFNHDALQDPRVELVLDDGRHYLKVTRRRFQVVISEPSNPWLSGPARLFTRQFFELVRNKLTPNGIFVQWVPLYGLSTPLLKAEVRTFLSVFPHVALLRVSAGDLVLIGGDQPVMPSVDQAVPQRVRADLARVDSSRWELLARFVAGTRGLHQWVGDGPLNTDDDGLLEFGAPRYLLAPTLQANVTSVDRIPWRTDLARWGANAPLPLAQAFLRRGEIDRAAFLAQRAPAGPTRWGLQGDIAARQGNWITAADYWRRAGTASSWLHLAELSFTDGRPQRAAQALAHIRPDARSPYYHYLAMLVALQRGAVNTASAQAERIPAEDTPNTGWQILAPFFKDLIARRLGGARPPSRATAFDHALDLLRQHLERESGEPVLDQLLRRLRELPPDLLEPDDEQLLQRALRIRVLGPLELYDRGVSLYYMGRFGEARHALEEYVRALPADSGSTYATVLIERMRILRRPPVSG